MLHIKRKPTGNIYGCGRDDSAKEVFAGWKPEEYITGICTEPVKGNRCHDMCGRQGWDNSGSRENHKKYIGKALSKELEDIMDKRKSALYSKKDDNLIPVVKDDKADCEAQAIAAIVHDGDSAGAVIFCVYDEKGDKLEIAEKLVSAAAEFLAEQLG